MDGHEYNTVAIATCSTDRFQYITLRAPLPKLPVTIEQHSVRLQSYPTLTALPLLPPFNYEHTVLEDIRSFQRFPNVEVPPDTVPPVINRPNTIYMGGPIGPVAPVLARNEALPYTGREGQAVGPYNDSRAVRWFYSDESRNPQAIGQLREKYGAVRPDVEDGPSIDQDSFFYNEQIWTMPWHFTEFVLPNHPDRPDPPPPYDADQYHVTSAFISPTARWRRWTMPSTGVPASIPPVPPDLTVNVTPDGGFPLGSPRRAVFWFSPDYPGRGPGEAVDRRGWRPPLRRPARAAGLPVRPGAAQPVRHQQRRRGRRRGRRSAHHVGRRVGGVAGPGQLLSGGGIALHRSVGALQPAARSRAARATR